MCSNRSNKKDKNNFFKAINERKSKIVHLTHNDLDAAGCDAIHRIKYGKTFTIWSSVGKFLTNLSAVSKVSGKGDTLSISDLGYQKGAAEIIKSAKKNGWVIEWRDHHRWSDEEISEISKISDYLCVDTGTCATGVVARDLMPEDKWSKDIAHVVCDYDLWRHNDPNSKILGEVCTKRKYLDMVRDCLEKGSVTNEKILEIYESISKEKNDSIRKSLKHTRILEGRYKIAFAPLYGYPSETAHAIREKLHTDIEVIVSENGKFSIRSVPPVSHLIAKSFNGGGHPPAAGGSFKFTLADKVSFLVLKKNRYYQMLFNVAEKTSEE
ncbi:oligoribonuclease NrnB/cAMP/cGMP phosphodiesterase (DHH superfamily) [Methanomicrobium sp. W14]|uniref:DHH family phosphoesterase n=1 Tax=Methanomicrobium sp. W14 TaxID=2817839 RepID=UPI001AE3D0CE|nr:phosphoesterase [Methanomicrobium sp. W14]MBP2132819.1 oligoribonuclease NrnB/cAMP/cGMP phosphodiesterase (DHH superfamily) [Methanomicrobium sp. W14]